MQPDKEKIEDNTENNCIENSRKTIFHAPVGRTLITVFLFCSVFILHGVFAQGLLESGRFQFIFLGYIIFQLSLVLLKKTKYPQWRIIKVVFWVCFFSYIVFSYTRTVGAYQEQSLRVI